MEGDVGFENGHLTKAQELGRRGQLAACMSAFLQFHACNYDAFRERQDGMLAELRTRASDAREGYHRRTPDATANGMLGWLRFLEFAVCAGAITEDQRTKLEQRGWRAFEKQASLQRIYQAQENQARLFVALIGEAVQGELGHLSTFDGDPPPDAERCGWRREQRHDADDIYRPAGPRVGYVDDDHVYLIKNSAYKVAQDIARGGTHSLSLTTRTLGLRLLAEKLLIPGGKRDGKNYSARRKEFAGKRAAYWTFDRSVFEPEDVPGTRRPEEDDYEL